MLSIFKILEPEDQFSNQQEPPMSFCALLLMWKWKSPPKTAKHSRVFQVQYTGDHFRNRPPLDNLQHALRPLNVHTEHSRDISMPFVF